MSYEKILMGNLRIHYPGLVKTIQELAIQLSKSGEILNRRGLVSYLNLKYDDLDLKEGLFIKNLLKDAYTNSLHSKTISDAIIYNFKENIGNDRIYNPDRIFINCSSLSFTDEYQMSFSNNVNLIEKSIHLIKDNNSVGVINNLLKSNEEIREDEVFSITGSSKVDAAYKYGREIVSGYKKLIEEYEHIKDLNLNVISDFEFLRNELKLLREDLIQLLIDLFGDRIKQTNPDLFDFNSVEWLDFEDAWEKIDLYFLSLNKDLEIFDEAFNAQMKTLLNTGLSSGKKIFDNTLNTFEKSGAISKKDIKGKVSGAIVGLAIDATFSVLKSRSESKKTVAKIYRDIELIKEQMHNDSEKIISDILRLGGLYSKLKDKLIPSFKLFIDSISQIVITDIKPLYTEILTIGNVNELRDKNSKLLKEKRDIERELVDIKWNFRFIDEEKEKYVKLLSNSNFEYNYIFTIRPKKPSTLYSIISLGNGNKLYNEVEKEWKENCEPFVELYKSWEVALKDEDVLKKIAENDITLLEERKLKLEGLLKENSFKIFNQFSESNYSKDKLEALMKSVKIISDASKTVLSAELKKKEVSLSFN
ncbi:hypothetical protein [Lutibacter flavus]|uniref:Uncharacterized protein n=1 Tax=Lutibacter flavus TaxID=691689 RepID=A0A238XKB6_9FLAO|nr:hypothetical protein [Lutibacter flavus]SNR58409.1 hypothetical protein SAMN04488111_1832 [Lutibacter flavus]